MCHFGFSCRCWSAYLLLYVCAFCEKTYVALSRARTMEGLRVLSYNAASCSVNPAVLQFYASQFSSAQPSPDLDDFYAKYFPPFLTRQERQQQEQQLWQEQQQHQQLAGQERQAQGQLCSGSIQSTTLDNLTGGSAGRAKQPDQQLSACGHKSARYYRFNCCGSCCPGKCNGHKRGQEIWQLKRDEARARRGGLGHRH